MGEAAPRTLTPSAGRSVRERISIGSRGCRLARVVVSALTATQAAEASGQRAVAFPRMATTGLHAPITMSYARARLFLGASAVGTIVVIAALAIAIDAPGRALPSQPVGFALELAWLAAIAAVHGALMAPFDLFGGWLLPREYGRSRERLGAFLWRWWRGAGLFGVGLVGSGAVMLIASRWFGAVGTLGAFLLLALVLLELQPRVAALTGAGRLLPRKAKATATTSGGDGVVLLAVARHVTGGAFGMPGRTRWVTPRHWLDAADAVALSAQGLRRAWIQHSGARDRGVLLAVGWNMVAILAGLAVYGPPATVADVARFALIMTLWAFVGLLVLPTPSRWGVYRADLAALAAGVERERLAAGLRQLERDQDDELERSNGVETVFHPVPAVAHRIAVMRGQRAPGPASLAAWHAARTALVLSWAGMGLLGRAVHCNVGRPEVWVLLPSD